MTKNTLLLYNTLGELQQNKHTRTHKSYFCKRGLGISVMLSITFLLNFIFLCVHVFVDVCVFVYMWAGDWRFDLSKWLRGHGMVLFFILSPSNENKLLLARDFCIQDKLKKLTNLSLKYFSLSQILCLQSDTKITAVWVNISPSTGTRSSPTVVILLRSKKDTIHITFVILVWFAFTPCFCYIFLWLYLLQCHKKLTKNDTVDY